MGNSGFQRKGRVNQVSRSGHSRVYVTVANDFAHRGANSLKLTHVALEAQKHGPKQALDNLKKVLRLARKIFGGIDTPDDFALRNSVDTHRSTTPAPPELHVPTGVANGKQFIK